jgi:hypothetical protein
MKITVRQSNIRTIKNNDPRFTLIDGVVTCPRAGFEISSTCPTAYKDVILQAIEYGYLKPVANVYGKELTMDALRDNTWKK